MAATANPDAITRPEFESTMQRMVSRLTTLEAGEPRTHVQVNEAGRAMSGQFEVVTQNEFRLVKWLGTFALAAVLGGLGFLYQQSYQQFAEVRIEMRDLHATVLQELHAQIGGLRKDMQAEHDGMRAEHDSIRQAIGSVRERVVRVETLLTGEEPGPQS